VPGFLKTEAFYLLVLVAVVLLGAWQGYEAMQGSDTARRRLDPVNKRDLLRHVNQEDATALRRHPETRSYRFLLLSVDSVHLYTGAAVACIAVVLCLMRGRLMPPVPMAPVPWGLWDVLKVAALFGLAAEALRRLCADPGAPPLLGRDEWFAAAFARLFLIGAILLVVLDERKGALAHLGMRGPALKSALLGLAAFVVLQVPLKTIETAQLLYVERVDLQETLVALLVTRDLWALGLIVLVGVVIAPVAEELLFRGYLQPAAEQWFGTWPAIFLSALFFAAAHPQFSVMLPMFILGFTAAWIFARTRCLAGPILLHAANNAQVVLYYLAIRHPGPTP
jgi:membrane protease YdiL (CAAX protease family)